MRKFAVIAGALLLWSGLSARVRADLTVVSQVHRTGGKPQNAPPDSSRPGADAPNEASRSADRTTTTYYKGRMARVESPDGMVWIYDGVKNRAYALDATKKTYRQMGLKQAAESKNPLMAQMPQGVKFDARVMLIKSEEAKTFAGKTAALYRVTGEAKIQMEGGFPGGPGGGGGFPGGGPGGGGGFPGGGQPPRGGPPGAGGELPSMQLEGEFWLTDSSLLPEGVKSPALAQIRPALPDGPFSRPLLDRLNKLKMLPLSSRLTLTMKMPGQEQANAITITTEVAAITEAPLANSLFTLPLDYKKAAL